jgi:ligand-binding SRPBCC domain-containing protein
MMKVHAHCQIAAPKSEVFRAFSDVQSLSKNVTAITGIELLSDGEIGVGTRFKETRVMFGKESSEIMEITRFAPHDFFTEEARSGGMHYVSNWSFVENEGCTRVSIDFTGTATTFTGRIMGVLFSFMAGSMKKAFLSDMEDLKRTLEGKS